MICKRLNNKQAKKLDLLFYCLEFNMQIMFLDTETTGLLKPYPADITKQPHCIELYACVTNEKFELVREYNQMFKVDFELPDIIKKITNINDNMLKNKPYFSSEVDNIAKFVTGVDVMVAHNLPFDLGIIANEVIRADKLLKFPWPRHHICTVEKTIKIRGHRLRLAELHKLFTGKEHANAHRAKHDVFALVTVFKELVKNEFINLEDYK